MWGLIAAEAPSAGIVMRHIHGVRMSLVGYEQTSSRPKSTSALPPKADIQATVSVIVLISPGLPPTSDILGEAGNVSR